MDTRLKIMDMLPLLTGQKVAKRWDIWELDIRYLKKNLKRIHIGSMADLIDKKLFMQSASDFPFLMNIYSTNYQNEIFICV